MYCTCIEVAAEEVTEVLQVDSRYPPFAMV